MDYGYLEMWNQLCLRKMISVCVGRPDDPNFRCRKSVDKLGLKAANLLANHSSNLYCQKAVRIHNWINSGLHNCLLQA